MSVYFDDDHDLVDAREPVVRSVGLGPVWDHLTAQENTPVARMLRGIVSALAVYMDESGLSLSDPSP